MKGALDVDIEYLVKVLFLNEFREIARSHSDIVDEDVDPTERCKGRIHCLCDMRVIGNVQLSRENFASGALESRFKAGYEGLKQACLGTLNSHCIFNSLN